jgi:glycosyltransferase involved in cell wall biosynthesis
MFSIICVYNNKQILNEWLLKSLSNQTNEFELILLDNKQKRFKSAAEALNYGGRSAKNEYLLFVHQDIDFLADDWLEKAETSLKLIPDLGIAGVAGKTREGCVSNIDNGYPPRPAGTIQITHVEPAQTLDECLLIIPTPIFDLFQFDEKVCDDWHLYGVDYCLTAKKMGYEVCVLPLNVYHKSAGQSLSKSYFKTLNEIQKKWRDDFSIIFTTMGDWKTQTPLCFQSQYHYLLFNYALDRYVKESSPIVWKLLKILNLMRVGVQSKIGEMLGTNKIGLKRYVNEIRYISSVKKD